MANAAWISLSALGRSVSTGPLGRLRSRVMAERYGLVLVSPTNAKQSADDIVAERQGDGWELVSKRVDRYGAEVIVFTRPC